MDESYVEVYDWDDKEVEEENILSFESLRKAFATIQNAETELAQTIPEIETSANRAFRQEERVPDKPNYEIDDVTELEYDIQPIEGTDSIQPRLESIVEAILFVGNSENRPIPASQIADKLRNVSAKEVETTVNALNAAYEKRNNAYKIQFDGDGYQMVLRDEFESVRTNFYSKVREVKLSPQALSTLAIVACSQPITAEGIQSIRKQSSVSTLKQLVQRDLLSMTQEGKYQTTERFLKVLRIPSLEEVRAMMKEQGVG